MKVDFVWCDGMREVASNSYAFVVEFWKAAGKVGKVWKRTFADDGLLEGIENLTPPK